MMRMVALSLTLLLITPTHAIAFGVADDGGCCGIPRDRIKSAQNLITQLSATSKNDLELRLALGEICTHYDCGVLNEDEARRAIHAHLADNSGWWDRAQKIGLAIIAFSGLTLGILNRYRPRA